MSQPSPSGKRILSIDGGGFRGLGCLLVVQAITDAATKLCREPGKPPVLPCEIFDLICGSSTGGLLAVLLGRLGLDCATAIQEYKALAQALFGNDRNDFMDVITKVKPLYDPKAYEAAIADVVSRHSGNNNPALPFLVPTGDTGKNTQTAVMTVRRASGTAQFALSYEASPLDWLVKDIVQQTTAAPPYVSEFEIQNKGKAERYSDAAYSNFINPSAAAKIRKLWTPADLGAFISLGQWFSKIALPGANPDRSPADKDAEPFVPDFLGTYTAKANSSAAAKPIVKQVLQQAAKTVAVDKSLQSTTGYYRVDPPLGIGEWELVDHFFPEVETNVKTWLQSAEGKKLIDEIATKLVVPLPPRPPTPRPKTPPTRPKTPPVRPETPPPPPEGTHEPNEACKKPKPKELLDYLKTFHVIFIIDDSTSMIMTDNYSGWSDARWMEARNSLGPIADFAYKNNVDTIDMNFLNSPKEFTAIKSSSFIIQKFDEVKPPQSLTRIQRTPTGKQLKKILDRSIAQLDAAVGTPAYCEIRPFDIILLTDGEADDNPTAVLEEAWAHLQRNKHHPNYIGVQIVQIGNSTSAAVHLKKLMQGNIGSIVDTVDYDGAPLTSDKLTRILLGGVQPNVRALYGAK